MYDYMIVGAGLFGAVFAERAAKNGARCLVIDKRDHLAGNCHTTNIDGVLVHAYGPHVFHTNSAGVWRYVNQFTKFNSYINRPKAIYRNKLYSLPVNLLTLNQLWGTITPKEAKAKLDSVRVPIAKPSNLEEWALSQVGEELYQTLFYGYTRKQWGREPRTLPATIIKRLPIRMTYDDNYYNARYQGIPVDGYTAMVDAMLDSKQIDVRLGESFDSQTNWRRIAKKLVFTGSPDFLCGYEFGELEYRSLRFEHTSSTGDVQGTAIVNNTEAETPYTRQIEHKFFADIQPKNTIVTREYPVQWARGGEAYYPIADESNESVLKMYKERVASQPDVLLGGRLGRYRYWDMDQTVAASLQAAKEF